MSNPKRHQFVIRALRSDRELNACLELEHSYTTEHVWQVDIREESDDLHLRFRTVRLPRPMSVTYPRDRAMLATSWEKRDCFLVAAADDIVLGYINMRVETIRVKGWIQDLVVNTPFRRRKIGSALIEQAIRWARLHEIKNVTLETQTKNYPAILFAQNHGFVFCGFNDDYYMNQDIAVFFSRNL